MHSYHITVIISQLSKWPLEELQVLMLPQWLRFSALEAVACSRAGFQKLANQNESGLLGRHLKKEEAKTGCFTERMK